MGKLLVSVDLWAVIAPLLPAEAPKPKGGRPRLDDRKVLTGIIFVLKTGISWELLPQELGCGSGMTCWRRLRDWNRAGVWERLHREMLQRLADRGQIDWSCLVGFGERAGQKGGEATGPNPTDRGKPGSKRHVIVDRGGIPLAGVLSAANVHDSLLLEATLDAIPTLRQPHGHRGRPRCRPAKLHADKGYDYPRCRRACRRRGIVPSAHSMRRRVSAWDDTGGWLNGRWHGSNASAASPSAMNAALMSIRHFSP
jgi:transposase